MKQQKKTMPIGGTFTMGEKQPRPASTSKVIYGSGDLRDGKKK